MSEQDTYLAAVDAATEPATDYERGWRAGYCAAIGEVKAAEHALADLFAEWSAVERRRWRLRGEQRSRRSFADPHKDDYPGRGDAA